MTKPIVSVAFYKGLANGLILSLIIAGIFWYGGKLAYRAMLKEQDFYTEQRRERCAKWGENIPKKLESYCDNLGV